MISAEAVDVLQADATRCSLSVFIPAAHLCQANFLPFSSHTAPALHCHVCCSLLPVRHMEYFYDHVRIEKMFFDGLPVFDRAKFIRIWTDREWGSSSKSRMSPSLPIRRNRLSPLKEAGIYDSNAL